MQVPAVRERTVAMLRNVSDDLARPVAEALGMRLPRPMRTLTEPPQPGSHRLAGAVAHVRPGPGDIRGRRIAILLADGVDGESVASRRGDRPRRRTAVTALGALGHPLESIQDQYRHCKAILTLGAGAELLDVAGITREETDWAITRDLAGFMDAVGRHRNWDRFEDPPTT